MREDLQFTVFSAMVTDVTTEKSIDELVHHVAETVKPAELWELSKVNIIRILEAHVQRLSDAAK